MSHGIETLLALGRNTANLDRAVAFYCDALGFRVDAVDAPPPAWTRLPGTDGAPARSAQLSLGQQRLELTEFPDAQPYPAPSTSCDLWFQHCAIVASDMHAAYQRLLRHGGVAITRGGPQTLPPSTGSVSAFKFRDPDGHPLELIHFPERIGDPVWQRAAAASGPTIGIDHSAISVASAARSIKFYKPLGLHVAVRGVNRGAEQQRLDALEEVDVDVVALRPGAARTPHLELLGYRAPRGRAANPAAPITAIAADRLVWQACAIDALLAALTDAHFSPAAIASAPGTGATIALLRDPDGHLHVLTPAGT